MKKVELSKSITSSVLGFGCASILGSVDAKKARRAIECALDYGINYFDLARSYGYGEAERFVGKIMRGRRDKVVLASKFGIKANWKAKLLRPVKPLIRPAIKFVKSSTIVNSEKESNGGLSIADKLHFRITLNPKEMKKSIEQSLRELKTDYLDTFFIHEPLETLSNLEELVQMSELLKKEGKIKAWGIAYMNSQEHLHYQYLNKFDILQFDNPSDISCYENLKKVRGYKSNVIFSPLRGGSRDLPPAEKLRKLNSDFPNSVILCSMFNEQHLKANSALFN